VRIRALLLRTTGVEVEGGRLEIPFKGPDTALFTALALEYPSPVHADVLRRDVLDLPASENRQQDPLTKRVSALRKLLESSLGLPDDVNPIRRVPGGFALEISDTFDTDVGALEADLGRCYDALYGATRREQFEHAWESFSRSLGTAPRVTDRLLPGLRECPYREACEARLRQRLTIAWLDFADVSLRLNRLSNVEPVVRELFEQDPSNAEVAHRFATVTYRMSGPVKASAAVR
jgi:DNA-binding SARP family transcriptional activator